MRLKIIAVLFILLSFSQVYAASKKKNEAPAEEEKTVITILNALKSSNVKDKNNEEDLILFEGAVKIAVEKGKTKTIISADSITYSRKHEMLYAEGNVNLEQTDKSGSVSNITAVTVLFNTSTLEGIFDDGRISQQDTNSLNMPSGSTLVVGSDVFARNHSGTVAFKKGELTFCSEKHPHWRIKASRIWLLPGNEFAFFNAVLFVGYIPVLYLPAFYYPKDELVFNPVFGYKNRQGFYIQTTTYIFGRKPLENPDKAKENSEENENDASKYFNFIKPTKLMDQELQGIVLHNLDTVYEGNTSDYLKIMLDWYSNLGFAAGIDGKYKPKKFFTDLEGGFLLGFGNTIFQAPGAPFYLPFGVSGTKYYEKSNFLGVEMPFRYRGGIKVGINTPLSLTLSVPIYSDPFFNYDYGDRSETMDWFSYLLNNPVAENSKTTELQKEEAATITSFNWDLNGNYSVPLPEILKPFIDTFAFSSFNSSIAFSSKEVPSGLLPTEDNYNLYASERKFFYPSQITPIRINGRISGTLLSNDIFSNKKKSKPQVEYPVELIPAEDLIVKKDDEEKSENENSSSDKNTGFDFERDGLDNLNFSEGGKITTIKDLSFNLNYSISPEFTSQMTYSPQGLNLGKDFKWDKIQSSYIYVKVPVDVNDSISLKNDFLSMRNSVVYTPVYQNHPYLSSDIENGGYTEDNMSSIKKTDYTASLMEVVNTNTISLKPFSYYPMFADTGISYNTGIKFLRTKFIGDADNPEWDTLTVDFKDDESFTTHSLDATLSAKELGGDFVQSLTFSSSLPPQLKKYYGTLKLVFPFVTLTGETGVKEKSKEDRTWVKEPLRQALSISLFKNKLTFTESYNFNQEDWHHDSFKLALSYAGLQFGYTMEYTNPYEFDEGWVQEPDQKFIPYNMSLAYSSPSKNYKYWKNRIEIAPTLSTSLVVDFVRPTNSYFVFTPGISFRVNNFLEFQFSASSRNDVLYRYFQKSLGYPGRIPGEENLFVDLFNSFRFDKEDLRKGSGFKLKSLNFTITHDLHDWDLKCDFKIEPRQITDASNKKVFDFSPYFSISVIWRPMESIKTEILDEYGTWKLN